MSDPHSITVKLLNSKGLHARAAAKFVKINEQFNADVAVSKSGMEVSGRSIMGLMMLAARYGAEISIKAKGPDAEQVLQALTELVVQKFGEE